MSGDVQTPEAGWYEDPWDPEGSWRWWDGGEWTGHTAPRERGAPEGATEEASGASASPEAPRSSATGEAGSAGQPGGGEVEEGAGGAPDAAGDAQTVAEGAVGAPPGWESRPRVVAGGKPEGRARGLPLRVLAVVAGGVAGAALLAYLVLEVL